MFALHARRDSFAGSHTTDCSFDSTQSSPGAAQWRRRPCLFGTASGRTKCATWASQRSQVLQTCALGHFWLSGGGGGGGPIAALAPPKATDSASPQRWLCSRQQQQRQQVRNRTCVRCVAAVGLLQPASQLATAASLTQTTTATTETTTTTTTTSTRLPLAPQHKRRRLPWAADGSLWRPLACIPQRPRRRHILQITGLTFR